LINLTKHKNAVWEVKINRPEKANSLSTEMLEELVGIIEKADLAKGVILTGQGKTFSAGADLLEVKSGLAISPIWEKLSQSLKELNCVSIAALNGTVAGGAFGMILACDMRICIPSAKFFYPVMKMGFLPQPSDPKRLRDLIGPGRAKLLLVAGEKLDADKAYKFGLVDEVVSPENLMSRAHALLSASLAAQPDHIAGIKSLIN
jgi:enoyl-CoA hydratase/carnithine racemase